MDLRLAYHLLTHLNLRKLDQSTAVPSLGRDTYNDLIAPIPPPPLQAVLATRIDELFTEISDGEATLESARDDLATWRKALLKAAVTGGLTADWRAANPPTETGAGLLARILAERRARWHADPNNKGKRFPEPKVPETDDLSELPEGWVWAGVAQLGSVTGGITKNIKRDALPTRLPYLRVGNVYAGRLDLSRVESIGLTNGEVDRVKLQEGDLLVVEGNGSIDQIGRSAVWTGEIDPCVHQNHLIKVRPERRVFSDLIQCWLQSLAGRKELEARASSTSGLHTLSISKIEALRCPLPPLAEIPELLSRLRSLKISCSEAAASQQDAQALSDTLRQSILAAAFRGELVA